MRFGKRITDRSRYQLDFRNPAVREYATKVIDRLVNEYGVGYFKIDYNIEHGLGTDYNADWRRRKHKRHTLTGSICRNR